MKTKFKLLILSVICLPGILTGCLQNEQDVTPGKKDEIALELTLPAQTAIQTRSIDESRENEVNRLDVFIFDQNGDILPNVGHQVIRSFNQPADNDGTLTNKLEVPIVLNRTAGNNQQFYVVANATDAMLSGVTTKSQLEAVEFTSQAMPRYLFVMTGSTTVADMSALSNLPITLTRSVARFDVKLADGVTNFAIRSARVMQARDGAFAFQKKNGANVAWPSAAGLKDYASVTIPSTEERGFISKLYAFENYNGNAAELDKTTVIILGGEYASSGQTTYYRIELKDSDDLLQVWRNCRYEVTVNSVDGPGTVTEEDAVIGSANIRFTIDVWKETGVNAEFDGTTWLKVSENNVRLPRDASGGSIHVETTADEWTYTTAQGPDGKLANWLTVKKDGDACNYMATANTSGAERTAYFYIRAGQKLKIKVKVSQAYGDAMIIKLSSTGITIPSSGTSSVPASMEFTAMRENVSWSINSTITKFGDQTNWVAFLGTQQYTGTGDGRLDLTVAALTTPGMTRSAIVRLSATDVSTGTTEHYTFTITQNYIEPYLEIDRTYIASTQNAGETFKITVRSNTTWIAEFSRLSADFFNRAEMMYPPITSEADAMAIFVADMNGTALPTSGDKTKLKYKHTGDGEFYVRFLGLSGTSGVRDSYVALSFDGLPTTVPSGMSGLARDLGDLVKAYVRMHQGIYGVVEINGVTLLDRNLGASHYFDNRSAPTPGNGLADYNLYYMYGYKYQWGRVPDGYEVFGGGLTPRNYVEANFCTSETATKMPVYLNYNPDPNGYENAAVWVLGTTDSWFKVGLDTPEDQRVFYKFWDANGKGDFIAASPTWTGNLNNTNIEGVKTKYDPCPKGWRVPTAKELERIFEGGSQILGAFNEHGASGPNEKGRWMKSDGMSPRDIFFPASGAYTRHLYASQLGAMPIGGGDWNSSVGTECYLLSSSIAGDDASYWYYFFNNDDNKTGLKSGRHPYNNGSFVAGGMSIRCIEDKVKIY